MSEVLTVATLNVRTLRGRLNSVLQLMQSHAVDCCALQETRLSSHAAPAMVSAAARAGYTFLHSCEARCAQGNLVHGVALVSRWPIKALAAPPDLDASRFVCASLHRPRQRPLVVCSVYGAASAKEWNRGFVERVLQWATQLREDVVLLGDWNSTAADYPVSRYVATGLVNLLDDAEGQHIPGTASSDKVIDFGVSSGRVAAMTRVAAEGVADHQLVLYRLPLVCPIAPSLVWPRKLTLLDATHGELVARRFEALWVPEGGGGQGAAFRTACDEADVDGALSILMGAAEDALRHPAVTHGESRCRFRLPVQRATVATRADKFQSVRERRLRRFQRQLHEWARRPTLGLDDAIRRKFRSLRSLFPEIRPVDDWCDLQGIVADLLESVRRQDHDLALLSWHERMEGSLHAKVRWVMREPKQTRSPNAVDPHPQTEVEHFRAELAELYGNRRSDLPPPSLDGSDHPLAREILAWADANRVDTPLREVSAEALRRQVLKGRHKAAGLDQWTPEALLVLPPVFWEECAVLWGVVLHTGRVPLEWTRVRCSGIPKQDGGVRPLSIEPVLWRAGVSVLIKQLQCWVLGWVGDEVVGAVCGRGPSILLDLFHDALDQARSQNENLLACKLDLSKCFDRVRAEDTIVLLRRLGAPVELCNVLSYYDRHREVWVCSRQAVAESPIFPNLGLPQGGPDSPLRLLTLMAAWTYIMRTKHPRVTTSTYLDDRLIWCMGQGAEAQLAECMCTNETFERICGWQDNRGKRRMFATTCAGRARAQRWFPDVPVTTRFKMLGIEFAAHSRAVFLDSSQSRQTAKHRCERIAMAGGTWAHRRILVQMLVLSLFVWTGGRQQMRKADETSLASCIEKAVLSRSLMGRNRFLLWAVCLEPSIHPVFAMWAAALRLAMWRVRRRCAGLHACPPFLGHCFRVLFDRVGWTRGVQEDEIVTPSGSLFLGTDSPAAVHSSLVHGWLDYMRRHDPKLSSGAAPCIANTVPLLGAHRNFRDAGMHACPGRHGLRALLALPVDARLLARFRKKSVDDFVCSCGHVGPDMEHLLLRCVSRPNPELEAAPTPVEQRLTLRFRPRPEPPPPREVDRLSIERLAQAIQRAQACSSGDAPVLMATDGGARALSYPGAAASSWACVVAEDGSQPAAAGGIISGLDATPLFAETWALLHAMWAAARAETLHVVVFVDCRTVVHTFECVTRSRCFVPSYAPHVWHQIRTFSSCFSSVQVLWCPAHGRRPGWEAPAPFFAERIRFLNDRADKKCTEALDTWQSPLADQDLRDRAALAWTRSALLGVAACSAAFSELNPLEHRNV